jgi:hypothetical protein
MRHSEKRARCRLHLSVAEDAEPSSVDRPRPQNVSLDASEVSLMMRKGITLVGGWKEAEAEGLLLRSQHPESAAEAAPSKTLDSKARAPTERDVGDDDEG